MTHPLASLTMHGLTVDLSAQRFGRLLVLAKAPNHRGRVAWHCRCDCGGTPVVVSAKLTRGRTRSCGCLNIDAIRARSLKHGATANGAKPPEFIAWIEMRKRCTDPRNHAFADYGGRGIDICARWLTSFADFLADMGPRPAPGYSLDRIDNGKGYEPGNCRWATRKEQARNKRNNLMLTIDGRTAPASQWAEESGLKVGTIQHRHHAGWPACRLLSPVRATHA